MVYYYPSVLHSRYICLPVRQAQFHGLMKLIMIMRFGKLFFDRNYNVFQINKIFYNSPNFYYIFN